MSTLLAWLKRRSKVTLSLLSILVIFTLVTSRSIGAALLAPGGDPASAKLAEWGRNHYLGSVVSALENAKYNASKPKVGGKLDPTASNLLATDATQYATKIPTIVTPPLKGEGDLKTVYSVKDKPAIQVGYLRPDSQHTSYLAGVAIMQSSLLKFTLHPGFVEPGEVAKLKSTDHLAGADLLGLAATFNSGFKIKDSLGGYYQNGVTIKPMVAGKATMVIYADGHADIGAWGTQIKNTKTIASARQNLSLLVNNAVVTPGLNQNVLSKWGYTVKNAYYVWRSGVGVDKQGNLIYVAGNTLSVQSLANLLKSAGAVRAMELDINQDWISYMWYPTTKSGTLGYPKKLVAFTRPSTRYFTQSSRDFFAAYSR